MAPKTVLPFDNCEQEQMQGEGGGERVGVGSGVILGGAGGRGIQGGAGIEIGRAKGVGEGVNVKLGNKMSFCN